MARTYTITFPAGTGLISANGREHWRVRAKTTRNLRELARVLAVKEHIPRLEKVRVTGIYYPPDNRKRDVSNILFWPVKAGLDGITDSGVLEDDDDRHVVSTTYIRGDRKVPRGQVVIRIEECDGDSV